MCDMATSTHTQYSLRIPLELKERMNRLSIESHRSFSDPMRRLLFSLVERAEAKQKNGKK